MKNKRESCEVTERLVKRLFDEAWNQGKLRVIDEIFSAGCIVHSGDQILKGRKIVHQMIAAFRTGFADIHHDIEETIYADDKVIVRWKGYGTHQGIFNGLVPYGRKLQYHGITILKVASQKIIECWAVSNLGEAIQSLKVYTDKVSTEEDFVEDFSGPARKIYQWCFNSRPEASCKQHMINALRELFSHVPPDNQPAMILPDELFEKTERQEIFIARKGGKVRSLVYRPKSSGKGLLPVLIHMHGGGWSLGKPEMRDDLFSRKTALMANVVVINVDYRLAPEHPYPCGLDDCVAVYQWARKRAKEQLRGDQDRVAVSGNSAGGNLALALAVRMRDEGDMPDAVLALCPGTDLVFEKYPSTHTYGDNGLLYDTAFYSFVRSIYAPYHLWQHPYVSPMYADLRNFCPTLILSAGIDPLIDDNKLFYQKLLSAGNKNVEMVIFDEMPHAFFYNFGLAKDVESAYEAMARFLEQVL